MREKLDDAVVLKGEVHFFLLLVIDLDWEASEKKPLAHVGLQSYLLLEQNAQKLNGVLFLVEDLRALEVD